jgi:hypothetical protein
MLGCTQLQDILVGVSASAGSLLVKPVILDRFLDAWENLFDPALDLGAWEQDPASAFFAAQSDIRAQPNDLPVETPTRMFFAEVQAVAHLKMHWRCGWHIFLLPSVSF